LQRHSATTPDIQNVFASQAPLGIDDFQAIQHDAGMALVRRLRIEVLVDPLFDERMKPCVPNEITGTATCPAT
jgi:hypothetical protein